MSFNLKKQSIGDSCIMHRVFCSELPEAGGIVELDGREKEHLFKVFRARKGDVVQLLDGRGGIADGEVVSSGTVMVSRKSRVPEPQEKLHLCCAMPKKQKLDALLKQAAELGVWSIRPLRCERSVAEGGSRERWQLHLIEACKQSGNPFLPQITAECGVAEMLDKLNEENIDVYYGSVTPCKGDRSGEINKEKAIFIGPEGGFTPAELSLIEQKGGKALNFGPYTLRLETAAVAGLAVLRTFCAALCAGAVLLTAGCGCGDNVEELRNEAQTLKDEGKVEESKKLYEEAIAGNPDAPELLFELGKIYYDNSEKLEAYAYFQLFMKKAADDHANREEAQSYIDGIKSELSASAAAANEVEQLKTVIAEKDAQLASLQQKMVRDRQTYVNKRNR